MRENRLPRFALFLWRFSHANSLAPFALGKIINGMDREALQILAPYNVRDLSYLPFGNGERIKPSLFFRCGALRKLNSPQREAIKRLGIRMLIDLRTSVETNNKPDDVIDGVVRIHIPILREETMGITHGKGVFAYKTPPHMPDLYRSIVTDERSVDALKEVLSIIFDEKREGAIAWHCTAGKDRAGIVSALFLSALGVEREEIYKDYELSNATSEPKGRTYRRLIRIFMWNENMAQAVYRTMLAERDYLKAAFDAIEERWGTVTEFLSTRLGITKEKIAAFIDKYKA